MKPILYLVTCAGMLTGMSDGDHSAIINLIGAGVFMAGCGALALVYRAQRKRLERAREVSALVRSGAVS